MTLREELQAMVGKTERYIRSAELLRDQADYDSAVSRLYYSMFYRVEALLVSEGHVFSGHKAVLSAFGRHFVKTNRVSRKYHQWLCEAFDKRQVSDYDFVTGAGEGEVDELLDKTRRFVRMSKELLQLPD